MASVYDFNVNTLDYETRSLGDYRGKVLLIVNTATKCGLTGQYEQLQALYAKYREQGLEILDFPCNQFREQAPEEGKEYAQLCQMKFGTEFTIFEKIEVNGDNAHPLYVYLKEQQPEDQGNAKFQDLLIRLASLGEKREGSDIKWNFTKFLINRKGEVVARFAPSTEPEEIVADIERLLAESA
ncbi:glutathione peroxidase [Conchiformibius steedae DSM 2580]|uniref:Glutathione peroxidase n=1 Tax=Conchiformibius steedae DSM 2580 TaxID=1121352 RepID=A0AAE9HTU0_9NEIS|nr:glutathione peroxidase [Conchiformibius steedae]QMT33417.1 glutathione peroxidase [Conchiformibius steedae]URD68069.1 glutathione peroxidase [Conchiformibius steedae DSM 2580]